MNTLEDLQGARAALRRRHPDLSEQQREQMLPFYLSASASIAAGLPRTLALKAVLAAYDEAAPAQEVA